MTDVVKLCINANNTINGATATTSLVTGRHNTLVPIIVTGIPVSGVNGVTTNGYLDNRFMPQ